MTSSGPGAASRAFEERQQRFAERLRGRGSPGLVGGTIVVVPSITFPSSELRKIVGIQYYEERMLFALLWLRDPSTRILFATSVPIDREIIDYYLSFLDSEQGVRERADFVAVGDHERLALTSKLLTYPEAIAKLRAGMVGEDDAYMLPFNVTSLEQELADRLDIPIYGPSPALIPLGSKSGSRRVARAAGVAVLDGAEDLRSLAELEAELLRLRSRRPPVEAAVIKLNNGFSGQGNAILRLDEFVSPLDRSPTVFCAQEESWSSYAEKIAAEGAIVEELVHGPDVASPSVQLRIVPGHDVEVISTHDQILGGPDDQVYLGCRFPAEPSYRAAINDCARHVGRVLADEGVIGLLGIDFVVTGDRRVYLSEINLRAGGTTHPFFMAQLVTGGRYDHETGELVAGGRAKHYVATDNLKSVRYVGLRPAQVIDALEGARLAYSPSSKTGVTVHLLGAMKEYGKLGVLCIADSGDDAQSLYDETVAALDALRPL
ncbi:MAG: peptide ligase PGM1-related protein [Actinomycetota bacterium]